MSLQLIAEERRLVLLRCLNELGEQRANASVLHSALNHLGVPSSREEVLADLTWLQAQGDGRELVMLEHLGSVVVAQLTSRGSDVAQGRTRVPGVKRPSPRG
jgi:hypothetical protein